LPPAFDVTVGRQGHGLGPQFDHGSARLAAMTGWQLQPDPGNDGGLPDRLVGITGPLRHFFAGEVDALASVPVRLHGTEFQRRTWEALRRIPPGKTWSYRRLAEEIGDPRATRAGGAANGQNPIPVVVPCHRVIGTSGHLTGFGGGLERKRWLLQHEGALQPVLPLG